MNILFVICRFPPLSGGDISPYRVALELRKIGNSVAFFCANGDENHIKDFHDIPVFCPQYKRNWPSPFHDPLMFAGQDIVDNSFKHAVLKFQPEVIHIHHLNFQSTRMIAWAHAQGIKTVFTFHDYHSFCFKYHPSDCQSKTICASSEEGKVCLDCDYNPYISTLASSENEKSRSLIAQYIQSYREGMLNFLKNDVDICIAPSNFLKARFCLEFPELSERIKTVNLGIPPLPPLERQSVPERKVSFGFVGGTSMLKGFDLVISAFDKANVDAELHLWGIVEGNDIVAQLEKLSKRGNIIKHQAYRPEEYGKVFGMIDCLIIGSLIEVYPLSVLESLSYGIPIIAFSTGGIPEIVSSGKNGILVPLADTDAMANAISQFATDDVFRNMLTIGAEQYRTKTITEETETILGIYQELCKSGMDTRTATGSEWEFPESVRNSPFLRLILFNHEILPQELTREFRQLGVTSLFADMMILGMYKSHTMNNDMEKLASKVSRRLLQEDWQHEFERNLIVIYNLASRFKVLGKSDEAILLFTKLKDFSKDMKDAQMIRGGAFFHLGELFLKRDDLESARRNFVFCIAEVPSHIKARVSLKEIDRRLNPENHAIRLLETNRTLEAIHMDISDGCNISCIMCNIHPEGKMVSTVTVKSIKEMLRNFPGKPFDVHIGCSSEPMLNPDWADIVALLKSHGARVNMLTNGTLLNRKNIGRLFSSGLDVLRISLDGISEATQDSIRTKSKIAFIEKALEGIQGISGKDGNGPILGLTTVLMNRNIEEFPRFFSFAKKHGIKFLHWGFLRLNAKQFNLLDDSLFHNQEKHNSIMDEAVQEARRTGIAFTARYFGHPSVSVNSRKEFPTDPNSSLVDSRCTLNNNSLWIEWDGTARLCGVLDIGNVYKDGLHETWRSALAEAMRESIDNTPTYCSNCSLCYVRKPEDLLTHFTEDALKTIDPSRLHKKA